MNADESKPDAGADDWQAALSRRPGHGAVAVIVEQQRFLVIRRSATVSAPNLLCFAGGSIEADESPEQAVKREMIEELGLVVQPRHVVWNSVTAWGTRLEWVLCDRQAGSEPVPNPSEVAEFFWLSAEALLAHRDLLPSVPAFFKAWAVGDLELPEQAGGPLKEWAEL